MITKSKKTEGGGALNSLEIKAARARKGLTQHDVSRILDISVSSYCLKENGLTPMSDEEKIRLVNLFGWNAQEMNEYLFDGKLPIGSCKQPESG